MSQDEVVRQALADREWARRNKELRRQYRGQLVVVHHRQVIGHGLDRGKLLEEVERIGLRREEVVIVNLESGDLDAPPDVMPHEERLEG